MVLIMQDKLILFHYKPLFLTWINLNPTMDKWSHAHYKVYDEIIYYFANFNGATVEVWEWISNSTLHLIMDVITFQCGD